MTRATFIVFISLLFVVASLSGARAHTLGIDKADLIEMADGSYHLISRVPNSIAPSITPPQLPARCVFEGNPIGARGAYEVRFVFTCPTPLAAGDEIFLPWQREGALLSVHWQDGPPVTRFATRQGAFIPVRLDEYLAGSGSLWNGAKRYTLLGSEHILDGFDHLLFIFGLLLLVRGPWMLVKTVTAFTLAHSITLALATLGVVSLPPGPVEAAIALSIIFLALEVINGQQGRTSLTHHMPWLVAFVFGLLHGLGFAGALGAIGLPPGEIPIALLFFNIGVEIGQLIFVGAVLLVLWGLRRSGVRWPVWARPVPAYLIGTIATYWFAERAGVMVFSA
jgi:hypothetical protein